VGDDALDELLCLKLVDPVEGVFRPLAPVGRTRQHRRSHGLHLSIALEKERRPGVAEAHGVVALPDALARPERIGLDDFNRTEPRDAPHATATAEIRHRPETRRRSLAMALAPIEPVTDAHDWQTDKTNRVEFAHRPEWNRLDVRHWLLEDQRADVGRILQVVLGANWAPVRAQRRTQAGGVRETVCNRRTVVASRHRCLAERGRRHRPLYHVARVRPG
jgi:hypothetical protein